MRDSDILAHTKKLYRKNRRRTDGHTYTIPSVDTYPYQWLWDSCFHAIVQTHFDLDHAKDELRALVSQQFKNGMMPHMIYWQELPDHPFPDIRWGKRRTSSITQPPMLSAAVQKIYYATEDIEFVREMLPHIHEAHKYFFRHRDPRRSNLVGLINPDESGEDNSPRFDAALGLDDPRHLFIDNFSSRLQLVDDWRENRFVVKERMDAKHWVRDVPFNAILAESLSITAELATACQETRMASWSEKKARAVKQAMRDHLRQDGVYWSNMGYGTHMRKIKVKTWAIFMPLYAGVATEEEAEHLVKDYLRNKKEFHTQFRLPTVPQSEPSFNPNGDWRGDWWIGTNWRGPVWIGANWFITKGLRRYGYEDDADAVVADSRALLEQSGFREYYDPLTGEGHGAEEFTWGGLVLDMV